MNKIRYKCFTFFLILALALALVPGQIQQASAISSDIVISQVYGGGGNSGALYTNDFIELFNRGTSAVDLTGWSVQYTSATGTTWQVTTLSGTVQPGHYYLVQEAAGAGGTTPLPTPDATGSIAMSGTSGKVLVASTTTALSGATPSDASIVDVVGYGSANFFEGSAAAPGLSNTTAAIRAGNGCTDTDDNAADFTAAAPAPRNSTSASNACTGPTNPTGTGAATPNIVTVGNGTLLTVAVTPGTNPDSTGLNVACDLTDIGGSATQTFYDDGTNGDATSGDNTFSFDATVDSGTSTGGKSLPCTIGDAQARSGSATISLTVQGIVIAGAPVINEFSASTAGTDVEYIEIYGDPNTDYSIYKVLQIEGDFTAITVGSIDSVTSLGTTDANGLYLASLAANTLENGSLTFLLVSNFTGTAGQDLDTVGGTSDWGDGVFDTTPWDAIVDAVAVNDGGATDLTYGVPVLGVSYDGLAFAPGGASRIPDGMDTNTTADWVRNDFDLAGIPTYTGTPIIGEAYNTPGALNKLVAPQLVINEIDYDQPGTDAAEYVEIKNNESVAVSLNGVVLELVNGNGGGAVSYDTIVLPDVFLAAGDYFVVCANAATVANCDLDDGPDTNFIQNGAPDAVGLRWNGNLIDAVSYEGNTGAPYTEGSGSGLIDDGVSATEGISRCLDGTDTDQNNVDLKLVNISPGAANDCVDPAPEVSSTYPVNSAADFPLGANLTVTFSEPVNVSGAWFNLSCSTSGSDVATTVSGGPTTFTLNPDVDLADGENCTLTIYAAKVTDKDSNDPPDNMQSDVTVSFTAVNVCTLSYTPIYNIQGSGSAAATTGPVSTQGVVVGDNEGPSPALRGFYIQDAAGDGDATTSDGIFVFNGDNNDVNLGDLVWVSGSAGEFQDQTQISSVTGIAKCGTGSVAPVDINMPFSSATYLEQFEGMLVRFPQTLYVTEHFQLGRFGQVLLSSGARLQQPTNVVAPGAPALALQAENDLNKIILDDNLQNQNPDPIVFGRGGLPLSASNTLRGGDTVTGVVGIMTYTWSGNSTSGNAYRLRPINALGGGAPDFQPANPRPTSPPTQSGSLRVAGMNLLNYFNTFDGLPDTVDNCANGVGGIATDCRGADTQTEFDRQWPKTVGAILKTDADVIGVVEMENDGYGPDSAIQDLVNKLNAVAGAGTYAFMDVDANTGQVNALGTDAIKVGLVYKPASVTPVGTTAALNSAAFVTGGDTSDRNRPALAQAFEQPDGTRFIAVVNHFKSKGSTCNNETVASEQGFCNQVRVNAATELANWLATNPTNTGDPDIVILGDLNSYAMEDPITVLQNTGYTNLILSRLGTDAYSYVFDGQWGYLDHALASASLATQVTSVADYHINADEPSVLDYNTDFKSAGQIVSLYAADEYRISDHDPVLVDLDLVALPPTDISLSNSSVSENEPVGTFIGTLTSTDPNAGDTFTYSFCGGADDGKFQIAGNALKTNAVFDYETKNSYQICLRSTDSSSSYFDKDFNITITDQPGATNTFFSQGLYDGWILENGNDPGTGGKLNRGSADFYVGDNSHNRQYRSILSFNTSSIPDNAVITKVTLVIQKSGQRGSDPFKYKTHGLLRVDIRKGKFHTLARLQLADFQARASRNGVGTVKRVGGTPVYTATLSSISYRFINKEGTTQLRLRFSQPTNNDNDADYFKFYSGNATANQPQLIVEYYVP